METCRNIGTYYAPADDTQTPSTIARSARDGARDHEVLDSRRACALEHPCELVQGRAGRHDVVQHGDARSREVEPAQERPAHVLRALLVGKFRLRQRSEEHTSELQSLAYLVCRL